jgi:release factor glutamine methyltransferase
MPHDYAVSSTAADTSPNRLIPIRHAIVEGVAALTAAGVASPVTDVQELLAFVLETPRARLAIVTGVTPDQLNRFRSLIEARSRRVPLQHLTGVAGFRYLDLAVGPGVFIPRPETELLVEWGLAAIASLAAPVVVDLCSGSGAIALSVAGEHPGSVGYAVERSAAALRWLRQNVDRGPAAVTVVAGDATDPATLAVLDGQVDLVLANPPYVPAGTAVGPEVAGHDPAEAVFGGAAGLDVIRGIVARAAGLLRPGGAFAVEHDDSHATAVPALIAGHGGFERIEEHRDLAGRPRFATAWRALAHSIPVTRRELDPEV